LVWTTQNGILASVPGGKAPVTLAPSGSFPSVIALPNGRALAAWETGKTISVQTIP
jgi:hypothetical protein